MRYYFDDVGNQNLIAPTGGTLSDILAAGQIVDHFGQLSSIFFLEQDNFLSYDEIEAVMTVPLLEGTDAKLVDGRLAGEKMSKSLGNYVGIDESPQEMYGKLMSISDELMWRYFELLSSPSAEELSALHASHPMEAKHALARQIVTRYHGPEAAGRAEEAFRAQFSRRELPEDVAEIRLEIDKPALYRVIARAGLCKSGSEASRLIEKGGVDVEGQRVTDPQLLLERGRTVLIRVGQRHLARATLA